RAPPPPPAAATKRVTARRANCDRPGPVHTPDTAGGQRATLCAAAAAGADAVDAASAAMAGTTSQPSLSALVAAFENTERDTQISLRAVSDLEPYWESVRKVYAPFESGLAGPTGRVYRHEIPGGQLSNLRQQAVALGLGERFEEIERMYAAADAILGHLVKVTPSSKVVGDLALHLVGAGVDPKEFAENPDRFDIPDSVIGFLSGDLGDPPGGWPEPFRTKALAGRTHKAVAEGLAPEDAAALETPGTTRQAKLNALLFPGPTKEFEQMRANFGDLSVVETSEYLYGLTAGEEHAVELSKGKDLLIGVQAISGTDERGMRSVMFTLNGQLRPLQVRDHAVESDVKTAEKADPANSGHVASPFAGVVTLQVHEGDQVEAGATVATIEAMKMEASITTQMAGTVSRIAIADVQQLEGGDLVVVVDG
ncbi:MAG: pyruvate carboxylase, partial [Brevibacterium sp.]|nr:pyruvate carboxylase [Brevibacterium sp.]